jgi:hypothetical protein
LINIPKILKSDVFYASLAGATATAKRQLNPPSEQHASQVQPEGRQKRARIDPTAPGCKAVGDGSSPLLDDGAVLDDVVQGLAAAFDQGKYVDGNGNAIAATVISLADPNATTL